MTQKSQWRLDTEAKIQTAKSSSQKLRFALFHVWEKEFGNEKCNFEDFYISQVNAFIDKILDDSDKIIEKNE